MTAPAHPRAQTILDALQQADAYRVDGGPLLTAFNAEDGTLKFAWVDDEHLFEEQIPFDYLEQSELANNTLTTVNTVGERVTVEVFHLTPAPFAESKPTRYARFANKVLQFSQLDREQLTEILDELMYRAVGDDQASRINNAGNEEQIRVLVERGFEAVLMDTLTKATGLQVKLLA